jgi:hypothetical protein
MPQHLAVGPELQQSLFAQLVMQQHAADAAIDVDAEDTTGAAAAAATAAAICFE